MVRLLRSFSILALSLGLAGIASAEGAPRGLCLCLDPTATTSLGSQLKMVAAATTVTILVGPEGGLDSVELEAAARAGFTRARLGGFVLRTETVCAAVLGALVVWSEPA